PASEVGQAKVFPNPFRPFQGHTQIKFTNLPPATTIKIFSFSGNIVRELTTDANGQAVWNGKNSAGHDVASDIYLALIEGPGGKQIVKVGVQR
ncbi:MAG: T9SS type A sorting domain-containing protein, partial [Elusimicrobia bacterium]|nr:T9SS type A sorting domain-containing protein [Elusimicrobiota bacterium]